MYQHIAIIDFKNVFSHQDCLVASQSNNTLTYLNDKSMSVFSFDRVVSSHLSARHIAQRCVHNFLYFTPQNRDKIIVNLANIFNSDNNGGFNLVNFLSDFIDDHMEDVIDDYEKSILGSFITTLCSSYDQDDSLKEKTEVYFRMVKYENDTF